GDLFTRPIPRSLWGGKPLTPRDQVIEKLWPYLYSVHAANPEFTVLLSFYMDWGPLGALFGMAVIGVLARFLYSYFWANRRSVSVQVIFACALPFMVSAVRDMPVDTITRLSFVVLPAWLVFYVA